MVFLWRLICICLLSVFFQDALFPQSCEKLKGDIEKLYNSIDRLALENPDDGILVARQLVQLASRCPERFAFYTISALRFLAEAQPSLDSSEFYISKAEKFIDKYGHFLKGEPYYTSCLSIKYNRCRYFSHMGDYDRALFCFEELKDSFPENISSEYLTSLKYLIPSQLGVQQYRKGNYPEALRWAYEALEKLDTAHDYYLWYKGVTHYYLGRAYMKIGDQRNAHREFYNSIHTFEEIAPSMRERTDDYLLDTFLGMCDLFTGMNQPDSALILIEKSLSLKLKEKWNLPFVYRNKGEILTKMGKHEQALLALKESHRLANLIQKGKHVRKGMILKALGDFYLSERTPLKALDYFQQALSELDEEFSPDIEFDKNPNITLTPAKREMLAILLSKGKALTLQFEMVPADLHFLQWSLQTYTEALNLIQLLRYEFQDDESKELLSSQSFQVFENAIENAFTLFEKTNDSTFLETAFIFSEKSKSLSLLESINDINAQKFAHVPDSLLKQEFELQLKLANLERKATEAMTIEKKKTFRSQAFIKRRELDSLRKIMEKEYPKYHALKYQLKTIAFKDVKKHLDNDETFVEFFWGDQNIFYFITNQNRLSIGKLPDIDSLRFVIEEFALLVGNRKTFASIKGITKFSKLSHELYKKIIDPLGINSTKAIIAPDAWLHLIPFDALITLDTTTVEYRNFPYLIHQLQSTRVFSASVMNQHSSRSTNGLIPSEKLLMIYPKTFGAKIDEGLYKLSDKYKSDTLFSKMANKNAFFRKIEKAYEAIVFFTHAQADVNEPFIELYENEKLFLRDIYAKPIKTNMVVLAACEAGVGKIKRGEGIMSLARGFAYSGVPYVNLTLWQVRSGVTLKLTELFLDYYDTGKYSPSEALHLSKLKLLNSPNTKLANPYYWSGVVMMGR